MLVLVLVIAATATAQVIEVANYEKEGWYQELKAAEVSYELSSANFTNGRTLRTGLFG